MNESIISLPRKLTACLTALLVVIDVSAVGCKSSPAPAAQAPVQTAAPAPAAPASPQMSLEDLVAPIALYPDQLLGQLLIASVNSQEVLDLGNWLIQNQSIKADAAPAAAKTAGFSTSAQYLAAFPQVVDNMCQEMDWTKQLGEAFKADQKGVMAAIQQKRAQAKQQGNLQSGPQLTVASTTQDNQPVIEIKPADPQVVYVPQYNAETVYTTPAPAQPTTTVVQQSGVSTGSAVAIGLLSFGVGMAVGSAFRHDDYYPYPSWGGGGMYYGGRPYYPPPYRAPYYPGYRPAYGYAPPSNYHWNQYNRQTNININNNNYYGRYNNNNNNRPGGNGNYNRPNGGGNNGYLGGNNNNRPGGNGGNNRPGGGNNGYQGGNNNNRPGQGGGRPGSSMANANPGMNNRAQQNQRPGANGGSGAGRPNAPNTAGRNPSAGSAARPGGAGASGAQARPGAQAARPGAQARPGGASQAKPGSGPGNAGRAPSGGGAQNNRAAQQRPAAKPQPNRGGGGGGKPARAPAGGGANKSAKPSGGGGNRGNRNR